MRSLSHPRNRCIFRECAPWSIQKHVVPRGYTLMPLEILGGMKAALVVALVAGTAASPSGLVAPLRQRSARMQAVTLRGGAKEAPSRGATAPFAALVAAHGLVIAGYSGGILGVGTGSTLVACAAVSLSGAYKPYMIGVHVALLMQATTTVAYGAQSLFYNLLKARGASVASDVPRYAAMTALSAGALYVEMKFKPKASKPAP